VPYYARQLARASFWVGHQRTAVVIRAILPYFAMSAFTVLITVSSPMNRASALLIVAAEKSSGGFGA
jgi:hypothetical protein